MLAAGFTRDSLERCARMLFDPGISVVADAQSAVGAGESMPCTTPRRWAGDRHLELAEAAGVGLDIDADAIPVLDEGRAICGITGSTRSADRPGSLLIGCAPAAAERITGH